VNLVAWLWWQRMAAVAWKYAGADSQWTAGAVRAAALWRIDDAETCRPSPAEDAPRRDPD